MEIDTQPEGRKHVHSMQAFQNGRCLLSKRCSQRLCVQARLEICISISANQYSTLEVPTIPMAGTDVPLQCSSLWASNCTVHVHKASEAVLSSPQSQKSKDNSLFGQYPNNKELG